MEGPHHLRACLAAAGLLLGLLAAGCRNPTVPEVVVYTSVDQPHAQPVLEAFQEWSGIRVRPVYDVEASKTTGLVQRLAAERDQPRADVYWSSEVAQTLWLSDQGVLASWHEVGLRARVILVNTDRVAEARTPTRLWDLVDERWAEGEVAVANPLFGTTFTHAAALYATLGPERTRAFFQTVRDGGTRVVDGNATVRDLVASGEVAVGLTDNDDAAGAIRRGAPVRVVVPGSAEDGALFIPGTVALVAEAPNPAQGRALVDYLLSEEVERGLIEVGFFHASVRSPPPGAEISWPAVSEQVPRAREELREMFLR